ncbi:MAG: glycosyltransferase family 39 protein [Alphaproteobacteria bacterium]
MAELKAFSRSAFSVARLWRPSERPGFGWRHSSARKLPARTYAVLALLTLALYLPGELSILAMDRDEARYAQATKQMMESGDFLDIRFGDTVRYVQPAGIYWLQALATQPFGGPAAPIWAFRIPSLLSALASVLLLAWFGTRIASPAVGVSAALVLAASVSLLAEAHFAKIDATLLLSVLAAQIALAFSIEGKDKPKFIGWPLAFWCALGAGALLKGPIIFAVSGLTALNYCWWNRNFKALLRLRPLLGLVVVIAIVAPWLIAISLKTKGEFLQVAIGKSIGGKLAGTSDRHAGPPGYHTALFLLTFFPGVVLAGLGGAYAWKNRAQRMARYLISWIVPTWVLFELVPTKLPHYTLPVFPALALLAALGLKEGRSLLVNPATKWGHRTAGILFALTVVLLAAFPFVIAKNFSRPLAIPDFVAAGGIASVFLAGLSLWLKPSADRLLPLFAAMILTVFTLFGVIVPRLDVLWPSARIAERVRPLVGCGAVELAAAGYAEPSNLFYFGARTFLGTGDTAAEFLRDHTECGVAVIEKAERARFDAVASSSGLRLLSLGRFEGYNYVRGKPLELDVLVSDRTRLREPQK